MSSHSRVGSGPTISEGTKILCIASVIPALALVFYISSRILRGGAKVKKATKPNSASLVEKFPCSSTPTIESKILRSPEISHRSKKERRIQDLRRYFASPPSQQALAGSSSPPSKPFANHRCSISLKSRTSPSSRLGLRPLSLLSVIRKDNVKSKLAAQEAEKSVMTELWALADNVVGAHPDAKPLHVRSAKGQMVRFNDYRLVTASGLEIPWYIPTDRGVVVVPAIARGTSVKASASTSIRTIKYEKDRQRYPNSSVSENTTPSRIPVPKSPTLAPGAEVFTGTPDAIVAAASALISPAHILSSSSIETSEMSSPSSLSEADPNLSSTQAILESRSSSLVGSHGAKPSDGASEGRDQSQGVEIVPAAGPVEPAPSVEVMSNPSPKIRKQSAWDERMPGLVTVGQVKTVSEQHSGAGTVKTRASTNNHGRRRGLRVITNLGDSENDAQLPYRATVKRIPRSGHGRAGNS
ncbi:hypothetical protein BT96DRAFT_987142 [Gymnopus androsaceus JB14]|uniref:Uncharacterized protein n=1 Tax=Gymnopus androsaceus JB14 TaxID=1447944 RepID=A0A6A4I8E7_9AGAR|nr:hypothetical protein BT96DRAFT_987142 [Gymnopus androsaceus JB14]